MLFFYNSDIWTSVIWILFTRQIKEAIRLNCVRVVDIELKSSHSLNHLTLTAFK